MATIDDLFNEFGVTPVETTGKQSIDDLFNEFGVTPVVSKPTKKNNPAPTVKTPAPTVEVPPPTPQQLSNPISKKPLSKPLGNGPTEMRSAKPRNIFQQARDSIIDFNNMSIEDKLRSAGRTLLNNMPSAKLARYKLGDKAFGTREEQDLLSKRKSFQKINDNTSPYYIGDSTGNIAEQLKSGKINVDQAKARAENLKLLENAVADREYQDTRNANVAYGTTILATTPYSFEATIANSARALTPAVAKEAIKNFASKGNLAKGIVDTAKQVGSASIESTGFGMLEHGLKAGMGIENENSFIGDAVEGLKWGGAFGLIPGAGKALAYGAKHFPKTKFAQDIAQKPVIKPFADFASSIANSQRVQNFSAGIARALGADINKLPENIRKTAELDEALVALYDNADRYMPAQFIRQLEQIKGENFTYEEARILEQLLRQGLDENPNIYKNASALNDMIAQAKNSARNINYEAIPQVQKMNEFIAPKPIDLGSPTKPVKTKKGRKVPKSEPTPVNEASSNLGTASRIAQLEQEINNNIKVAEDGSFVANDWEKLYRDQDELERLKAQESNAKIVESGTAPQGTLSNFRNGSKIDSRKSNTPPVEQPKQPVATGQLAINAPKVAKKVEQTVSTNKADINTNIEQTPKAPTEQVPVEAPVAKQVEQPKQVIEQPTEQPKQQTTEQPAEQVSKSEEDIKVINEKDKAEIRAELARLNDVINKTEEKIAKARKRGKKASSQVERLKRYIARYNELNEKLPTEKVDIDNSKYELDPDEIGKNEDYYESADDVDYDSRIDEDDFTEAYNGEERGDVDQYNNPGIWARKGAENPNDVDVKDMSAEEKETSKHSMFRNTEDSERYNVFFNPKSSTKAKGKVLEGIFNTKDKIKTYKDLLQENERFINNELKQVNDNAKELTQREFDKKIREIKERGLENERLINDAYNKSVKNEEIKAKSNEVKKKNESEKSKISGKAKHVLCKVMGVEPPKYNNKKGLAVNKSKKNKDSNVDENAGRSSIIGKNIDTYIKGIFNRNHKQAQNQYDEIYKKIIKSKFSKLRKKEAINALNNIANEFSSGKYKPQIITSEFYDNVQRAVEDLKQANETWKNAKDIKQRGEANSTGYHALMAGDLNNSKDPKVKEILNEHYSQVVTTHEQRLDDFADKYNDIVRRYNNAKTPKERESILFEYTQLLRESRPYPLGYKKVVDNVYFDPSTRERKSFNRMTGKYESTGDTWDPKSNSTSNPYTEAKKTLWDRHIENEDLGKFINTFYDEDNLLDMDMLGDFIKSRSYKKYKNRIMEKEHLTEQAFDKKYVGFEKYFKNKKKYVSLVESMFAEPLGKEPNPNLFGKLDYKPFPSFSDIDKKYKKVDHKFGNYQPPTVKAVEGPKSIEQRIADGELVPQGKKTKEIINPYVEYKKNLEDYMKHGGTKEDFVNRYGTPEEYANFRARQKANERLDYKDIDSISSAIDDVASTKFAKANRSFTSHKITDYIDEIAKEDKDVQKLIDEAFDDNDLFDFADDFDVNSHGRVDLGSGVVTINSKDDLGRQFATIKHEVHHKLAERIALACGKDSKEYRMFQDGVEANRRMHDFEYKNPEAVKDWQEYQKLRSKDYDKGMDYLESLDIDRYEEVLHYDTLYDNYKNCDLEVSARNASKGEWKFFGKDAREYEQLLGVHGRGTSKVREGNIAKAKGDAKRSSWQVSKRESKGGGDDVRSHRYVQGPNDGYNTERAILNSKDWEEHQAKRFFFENIKTSTGRFATKLRKAYNAISQASKIAEAKKLELGIITPEEAKLRKKLVGSENGVYYKKPNKGSDKVDLLRDYSEEKASKVGIFGRKKKFTSDISSPEDILLIAERDVIKVSHIEDAINVLERNFAKPIENGRVLKGYVPVNKQLLACAMYSGNSQEWYKAIAGGKNSILNTFDSEWSKLDDLTRAEQEKYFFDLFERTKDADFQVPQAVFDKLFSGAGETSAQYFKRYGINAKSVMKFAGALIDHENTGFKRRVLVSGSFPVNNRIGNQVLMLAKSENPIEFVKGIANMHKVKDADIPSEVLEASILEAFKDFDKRRAYTGYDGLDNFLNLLHGHTIKTENLNVGQKALAHIGNFTIGLPNKGYNAVAKKSFQFNEAFERLERKQLFAMEAEKVRKDLIKKTGRKAIALEEAIKHINDDPITRALVIKNIEDVLGDYNKFSRTEKNVLKRIFPFYSWMRTISRHVYTGMKKNPARYALIALYMNKIKEEDNRPIKDYQRGQFVDLRMTDSEGRKIGISKPQANPFGTFEDQDSNPLASLTPTIKDPLEAVTGKKVFANMDFSDSRYIRQYNGKILDTKTGEELNSMPASVRLKYWAKQKVINTVAPYMDNKLLRLPERVGPLLKNAKQYLKDKKSNPNAKFSDYEYKTYDKLYDTSFGGFNNGDFIRHKNEDGTEWVAITKSGKPITRYSGSDYDEWMKALNSLGASTTVARGLNKTEQKEYEKRLISKQEQKEKKRRLNKKNRGQK